MASGLPPPRTSVIFGVLYTTAAYGARRTFWLDSPHRWSARSRSPSTSSWCRSCLEPALERHRHLRVRQCRHLASAAFALPLSWTTGALVRTTPRARERMPRAGARRGHGGRRGRAHPHRPRHARRGRPFARGVVIAQVDGARYAAASDSGRRRADARHDLRHARAALSGRADAADAVAATRRPKARAPHSRPREALRTGARRASHCCRHRPHAERRGALRYSSPSSVTLQEALTNALRHGARAEVSVRLAWHPGRVELSVEQPHRSAVAACRRARRSGGRGARTRAHRHARARTARRRAPRGGALRAGLRRDRLAADRRRSDDAGIPRARADGRWVRTSWRRRAC